MSILVQICLFLAAAAIAAPVARRLGISSVLGYLLAGVLIGPFGFGLLYQGIDVQTILHFAEFGVVMLLFLIGLELRPRRLWTMRRQVFGVGGLQVLVCGLLIGLAALASGLDVARAAIVGGALALSSTALALQLMDEKGHLTTRYGRGAFSILLFQDLAAIPMIAIVPVLAVGSGGVELSWLDVGKALAIICAVFVIGHYALRYVFKFIAETKVREGMTAAALLTVVGVSLLMEIAGLSAALGGFVAGALLADSEYRHQIEADIAPFEGLLLGLFFTAVGMSLDLGLLLREPETILPIVAGLLVIKTGVLWCIAKYVLKLTENGPVRLGIAIGQGGEFAFVLFTAAAAAEALSQSVVSMLVVSVTLSMVATPILFIAYEAFGRRGGRVLEPFDAMPEDDGHVIIAGLGRFGQVVARVLRAKGIHFTALDISPQHVDFIKRYGNDIYYGDASRLDLLQSAGADKARAFVLAIDDVESSLKTAEIVRRHFPDLAIYARARNRTHVHRLMDLGVSAIRRETFLSAVDFTRDVLIGLGSTSKEARRAIDVFVRHDRKRLYDDYEHYTDEEKLLANAREAHEELEEIFQRDAEELAREEDKKTDK
jgi:monovalent cation:proton antiporter-2 (CPA2) family protein